MFKMTKVKALHFYILYNIYYIVPQAACAPCEKSEDSFRTLIMALKKFCIEHHNMSGFPIDEKSLMR